MMNHKAVPTVSVNAASFSQAAPARINPVVIVACAKPHDGMCVALAAALKRVGRIVEIAVAGSHDTIRPVTTVSFVEESRSSDHIAGHLAWTRSDGVVGRGETLRSIVMDASLNDTMLDGYADALVQHARLPD